MTLTDLGIAIGGWLVVGYGAVLVCSLLPAPQRPDPRPIDRQLDDPSVTTYSSDPLTIPTLVIGERQPRVKGWAAGALGAEDGMGRLADQLAQERSERLALQAWAGELATMLAAHDVPIPALQRQQAVLDETEAGAR